MTARSSGPGPWPWVLAAAIVAFGALGFVWATSGQPRQPLIVSAPGDGSADAQQTMAAANATTAAFLTAPSPTATATSTPEPTPLPTATTPSLIDRYGICPANLNELRPGEVCYQSIPKVQPTPDYPVCDRRSNGLCRVPGDGSAHGEVETE